MEDSNPVLALRETQLDVSIQVNSISNGYYNITVLKGKVTISYLLMWIYDCKCRKYTFLGGSFQIITILHSGGCQNLLQYYMGGSSRFITILQWGGGSLGTPNLYYVIYGWPLTLCKNLLELCNTQ